MNAGNQFDIVAIGECMLELSKASAMSEMWRMHSGGDTLNTALYLSRMGAKTAYLTALGKDRSSQQLSAEWQREGISTELLLTHPTRLPGLYAISTDETGEYDFSYWRSESAVRDMFACPDIESVLMKAKNTRILFLTSITLSLFEQRDCNRIIELARGIKAAGGEVAFDTNYRPKLWRDAGAARASIERLSPHITIALPSLDNEKAVFGDSSAEAVASRWHRYGTRKVAVKDGANGAYLSAGDGLAHIPVPSVVTAVDTTGAGDSFNAAFLAALLAGQTDHDAVIAGHRLASSVVRNQGAIISKAMMPFQLPKLQRE